MKCKTIKASDIPLNDGRLDAAAYVDGHWTRISAMGQRCCSVNCDMVLAGAPATVWSTSAGLYCGQQCDPDYKG